MRRSRTSPTFSWPACQTTWGEPFGNGNIPLPFIRFRQGQGYDGHRRGGEIMFVLETLLIKEELVEISVEDFAGGA